MAPEATTIETLATCPAGRWQYLSAGLLCLAALVGSAALLPFAAQPMPASPGFVALNQTALVLVYAITTYLFFAQYAQTRSAGVLLLATGSLFTTGMVLLQLLCFPNVAVPGLLMGVGPSTLTWLWTFWHLAPPLFALPYALAERGGLPRAIPRRWSGAGGWLAASAALLATAAVGILVTQHVELLPKSVVGDDYTLLTTSGIGPALELFTIASLAVLCWTTRLRTVLQLWLAASLFLLVLDNLVTDLGAARMTLGWGAGRIGALTAAVVVLAVYLRELDFLRRRADVLAQEREAARADAQTVGDNLALALEAGGMGDWQLDLNTGRARRTARHDHLFGYPDLQPRWGQAEFLAHVVPEDREHVAAAFAAAEALGRLEVDCRIIRADTGAVRHLSILGRTYYDRAGRPASMAGCVMDVTERRQTEARLREAERMEAVGQLTGGVAHDFNNLLTVITGSLDLLVRKPGDADRAERLAGRALAAARRGADLTGKLLAFSRRQVVRPEITNLNRLVQDFLPLVRQAASDQVTVSLQLDPGLDPVRIDARQFEAALLNLAVNARDAMPDGGRLVIRTRNVPQGTDTTSGDHVEVTVSDTGCGMDAATARVAFEPFFTTKEVGRGTGLGLSQVYGCAKQAGGDARIESTPGQGTAVVLLLPREAGLVEPRLPATPDAMPLRPAASGEVVLVVEDDAEVQALAVESLQELGYTTLVAETAAAALERLRGNERIDLLFSDVVMPGGMNGVQLAVVARTIREGLKVVLTSGYTASALADGHTLPAGTPLLSKPYAARDLADTLRATLTQR